MTLHEEPGRPAAADLEEVAGTGLDPEYVLVHLPPDAWSGRERWRPARGLWGLFSVGEWAQGRGRLPAKDQALFAPRSAPGPLLAEWVRRKLGYPVALEPGWGVVRGTDWHIEPIYKVRRNT